MLVVEVFQDTRLFVKDLLQNLIWVGLALSCKFDGKKLIVEYDPEEDLIFAQPRLPLAVGTHQVEVVVRDICGNETRQVHTVIVE